MKYPQLALAFFYLFNFSIHAMDLPIHTLEEYKGAFSLASLKKHIIDLDDGLLRDFFPREAFKKADEAPHIYPDDLDNYLNQKLPCILRSMVYLNLSKRIRANTLNSLESELLSTVFSLHEFILDQVLSPIIDLVFPFRELGAIADPKSIIHSMMESYVEYLIELIRQSSIENEDLDKIDIHKLCVKQIIDKCPRWFKVQLTQAYKANEKKFEDTIIYVITLKTMINERKSGKYIIKTMDPIFREYGYLISVDKILPFLITSYDQVSKKKQTELGDVLIGMLNTKFNLRSVVPKHDFTDNLLTGHFAEYIIKAKSQFIKTKISSKRIAEDFDIKKLKRVIDSYGQ